MASIFESLREDHQRLKRILVHLRTLERGAEARRLLHDLARQYTAHAQAEENILYSYLLHVGGMQQRVYQALDDHQRIDALLRETQALAPDDARWSSAVAALYDAIQQHLRDEESGLFTLARGFLTDRESAALGVCFVAERERVYRGAGGLDASAAAYTSSSEAHR